MVYDNFQSIEITAKKLNKKKQKKTTVFDVHFGLRKKKMGFNNKITKTFFTYVFNKKTHKTFTGFFIPAIYIIYYTMFYKMNNKFEILRLKNGTTTKTVIKIIQNFTMVNSITNDEIN